MEDGITTTRLNRAAGDRFQPLRRELGVTTFGINQIVLEPGQRLRVHRHREQEEVYIVLDGRLTLLIEREEHRLGPDELIRVAPNVRRQLINRGPERVVLVALGGSNEHNGRDAEAFADWDADTPAPPQEVPIPPDLDPSEREEG